MAAPVIQILIQPQSEHSLTPTNHKTRFGSFHEELVVTGPRECGKPRLRGEREQHRFPGAVEPVAHFRGLGDERTKHFFVLILHHDQHGGITASTVTVQRAETDAVDHGAVY